MAGREPVPETDEATRESLELEREFLLRSLADLDAEHEAGDIEDDDFQSLTDDYTARAATVLRALEAITGAKTRTRARPAPTASTAPGVAGRRRPASGSASAPATSSGTDRGRTSAAPAGAGGGDSAQLAAALQSRRRWRTAAVVALVLGFGAVAAWAVAQSSGSRQPGQTATGNGQITGTTASGGVDPRISQAINLVNQGQVANALKLFDDVLTTDPNQPVALADGGWLEAQAGISGNRPDLVDTGLVKIQKAERVDASFADPHFFRGFLLLRAKNDPAGAVTELRTYLGLVDPASPQVATVQPLLQEAIKAAGPNVPAGPNVATSTTAPSTTAPAKP
jgi:hypothetical protein